MNKRKWLDIEHNIDQRIDIVLVRIQVVYRPEFEADQRSA